MKNKGNNRYKSNNKDRQNNRFVAETPISNIEIKDISDGHSKKLVIVIGIIDRIIQTGGPTIFMASDGTGILALKGFIAPGSRSFPEVEEGDLVKATVRIDEFQGELEGEISKMEKLSEAESNVLKAKIREIELDRAKANPVEFLVKSATLDKLRDRFIEAATQIKLAVIQSRPIIVRHHNDTDGYCSGFALERAILPLIEQQHGTLKASWEFFSRAPCAAPFYEITDSIRDTAMSLRNTAKFSNKMPLIIIADNGSTQEDLMAIKQGKIHGEDFIVVDHHGFDKDVISKEVLTHINPFLVDEKGPSFSAGMLCAELARFINNGVENIKQIPAMAGLADRVDLEDPKIIEEYLKVAKDVNYEKELLQDLSVVIDYVSRKLKFMEAREYIEVIFGEPRDKQKKLVDLMAPFIKDLDARGLKMAKANVKIEKMGKNTLQLISIEETFPGFGFFPNPGRVIGIVHEDLQKQEGISNLITVGVMNTAFTMRATNEADFSVHDFKVFVDKKCPGAFVEGGGHKNAGSLIFLPYKKDEMVKLLKEFVSKK